jgi:serine/threonine protein kinase
MSDEGLIAARYRLGRLIGVGGMGMVYRARDMLSARNVAIKLIARALEADELALRHFRREGALYACLCHPNIVAGLGRGYDELSRRHFIVMELVDGEDAGKLARTGRVLPVADVVEIVARTCDALTHAHRHGIVHGDVAPANILVRRADGLVKLTDFGLARMRWSVRAGGRTRPRGTPRYLAPEVADGYSATPLSDLYSLAAVAHDLIATNAPRVACADRSTVELDAPTEQRSPLAALRPDVPGPVAAAIARALENDPRERQSSVEDFRSALCGGCDESFRSIPA